ncbi:hypothetical protein IDH15_00225 [Pelagibacterales bacterium SAG-MED38]|nr:hypothetical protein [Pelagibacterales bacterium SAG-MED38]
MIVAFPIEISAREYLNKLFSAYQVLKNTNYRVVLGQKSEIYNFYKNNEGVYLISKGGTIKPFQLKKKQQHNRLSILDEEGPLINFNYKTDFISRTNSKIMKKLTDYYCWGKNDYDLMKKRISKKKLILSGHPKYDLCSNKYKKIFEEKKIKLNTKYGRFFLIASSFAAVDGYIDKYDYIKWISNSVENKLKNRILKDLHHYFNHEEIFYDRLVKFTKKISKENPKIRFVFRPHPRQDITKVKKRFSDSNYKNIFIIQGGAITPFIYACKYFLHSGCSTVFEAALLKKKIIFLENTYKNSNLVYKKIGMSVKLKNFSRVKQLLVKKIKYNMKKNSTKDFIYNNNKNFFFKELIKRLKMVDLKSGKINLENNNYRGQFYSNIKSFITKYPFLLKSASLINKDWLFNKEYKKSKFQKIKTSDLEEQFLKLQKIDKVHFDIKIKKINKDSYLLEKIN